MKFVRKKLSNGITVLFEKRDLPLVAMSIANPFGASHEPSELKGIAHFIEHLVFTGTKTRTHEDISREIEKRGGILNAFTAQDVTAFWCKLPSNHLQVGLDILTDILKNPAFKPEKFEKEKKVVLEEIKMYRDNPQRHIYDQIESNLYSKPFGEGIAGSEETLKKMTRNQVMNYFKEKYAPENFIVTIVGNADIDKVCKHFEKAFKPGNRTSTPQKIKKHNKHTVQERPGVDQAHLVFARHAPLAGDKKAHALEVLNSYLADGMSSKLFLKIREEKGLAYTVHGSITKEKNYAYNTIYVGTTKEAIPTVKEIILQEFGKVHKKITAKEVDEIKEQLVGLRKVGEEQAVFTMTELIFSEISGKAEDYYEYEKNIRAVTPAQVKELALIKDYSTAVIVPK